MLSRQSEVSFLQELPPVFSGMDRDAAMAFLGRLIDARNAGAVLWDDQELLERFIANCSRTNSAETKASYQRDLRDLVEWRDFHHPSTALRLLDPSICQDYVDQLVAKTSAGEMALRTFNRRVAAISAFFRWASEPNRSGVTGVCRNPMPRRILMKPAKCSRGLAEQDLDSVLGVVAAAARDGDQTAVRDYVLIRGAYLLGLRVGELSRLKWQDIQTVDDGGFITVLGKGSKTRTIRVSRQTVELFESLGRGEPEAWVFTSCRTGENLTRQAINDRMARWGRKVGIRLHCHRLRHTHANAAIRRGVDTFCLQSTLGHSSAATTAAYVAENPSDSSSLRLG